VIRRLGAFLICALVLTACDKSPSQPPVVVFATGEDGDALSMLFEEFTDDTDIPVTVVWASSAANANKLIDNTGGPADVLITDNVADIWRAADRGALRPILSEAFDSLHAALKDPDRGWAAVDVRFHVISHAINARPLTIRLDDLGSPEFSGRVCLSSSGLSINRSLIAYLIDERGVKEAERLVRRWVKNLAASPFATEAELAAAIQSGQCDYGITSWPNEFEGVAPFRPDRLYIDVSAAGVGRHAGNPEAAQELVDWFLRNRRMEFDGDTEPVFTGIAGWRDEEARLLTERAGYR
jgi:iron(III) transport system substrate-binding protein